LKRGKPLVKPQVETAEVIEYGGCVEVIRIPTKKKKRCLGAVRKPEKAELHSADEKTYARREPRNN